MTFFWVIEGQEALNFPLTCESGEILWKARFSAGSFELLCGLSYTQGISRFLALLQASSHLRLWNQRMGEACHVARKTRTSKCRPFVVIEVLNRTEGEHAQTANTIEVPPFPYNFTMMTVLSHPSLLATSVRTSYD
ncbi:hypothetical protein Mapa_015244 [Marchantia paleacea]|nr:hypothetical protein Mapa_015244 [Marchantia paleacea]